MSNRKLLGLLSLGLLVGCTAPGPVENPIGRTLTWFSYVGGEDIRNQCQVGAPDRWRFVYNGTYEEQVRGYDVAADPISRGAVFEARVYNQPSLVSIDLRDPLGAWKGKYDRRLLNAEQREALQQALASSGFNNPAPKGQFLRSDAYYWVVSACQNGQFHLNAWQQPGQDLSKLTFVNQLLDADRTGLAYNRPRQIQLGPFYGSNQDGQGREVRFQLQVAENGLNIGPRFR